jgi:arylsulfatase A-like enzyme
VPANQRPNLLLVVLDTLTADAARIGAQPAHMPALSSLAERGMVFDHAVANSPWTYPSHASLFTGLLPSEHRMEVPVSQIVPSGPGQRQEVVRLVQQAAPNRRPSLADRWLPHVLARSGYETVLMSNNPWVGRWSHMDHGFERVEDVPFVSLFNPPRLVRKFPRLRTTARAADYAIRARRGKQDLRAGAAVERIRSWERSRDRSRPFFLFVNLMEAHLPYFTPLAPRALKEAGAGPLTTFRAMRLTDPQISHQVNIGQLDPGPHLGEELRTLRALHRHAAAYLDERVRELHELSAEDGRGLVVCVTSDHGDAFGEHHAVFHGITLDEPILHIPLVLWGDGIPVAERRATVELRQVYATLLSAAGAEVPDGAAPSLTGEGTPTVVSERDSDPAPAGASSLARERLGRLRAVYRDPYKLVVTPAGNRLFDLSTDPSETTDLAPTEPAVVAELTGALPPWPEGGPEPEAPGEDAEPSLSAREQDEIARQLAALGYLE